MKNPHYRYFIELHGSTDPVPRLLEAESRRAAALGFIEATRRWLLEKNLDDKVSALSVTMFGQIQITCDTGIIRLLRNRNDVDIVAIREAAIRREMQSHWNEAH